MDLSRVLNTIIRGDAVQVMEGLPSNSIDLIITSPPYNLKNSSGNGMKDGRGGKWKNAALREGYDGHNDDMPYPDYIAWQRRCLAQMLRVIKEGGAIFYNHKWRVQNGLLQDRKEILEGFPVRQIIIWKRKGGINFNRGYFLPTYEVIYLIAKKEFKLVQRAIGLGDVWEISQELKNPHPAPFPVELTDRILSSCEGRLVLDPFIGSGTTAISAIKKGWDYIGIELSDNYCKMARERIAMA